MRIIVCTHSINPSINNHFYGKIGSAGWFPRCKLLWSESMMMKLQTTCKLQVDLAMQSQYRYDDNHLCIVKGALCSVS